MATVLTSDAAAATGAATPFPPDWTIADAIFAVVPDLAVEVLSKGNTEAEMQRKLTDYFAAGVRLVWYIDPPTKTAKAYTSPEEMVAVGEEEALAGRDVLPEFELSLRQLFSRPGKQRSV